MIPLTRLKSYCEERRKSLNSMKKVILPVVMSMFMVFTMMPAEAFAVDAVVKADSNSSASPAKEELQGDATSDDSSTYGVYAHATDGGTAEAKVTGNVDTVAPGVYADTTSTATNKSTAKVEVGGDVKSKNGVGVNAVSDGSGTTTVNVGGNVTSENDKGVTATGRGGGTTTVNVGGNVTSEATNPSVRGYGAEINADDGGKTIIHAGNINSNKAGMVVASKGSNSSVEAVVQNVTSTETDGLVIISHGPDAGGNGNVDVLVNGTVKGKNSGIYISGNKSMDKMDIKVWKIETDKDGMLFAYNGDKAEGEVLDTIRQHVHYIVKIDEKSEGVTFSATKGGDAKLDPIETKYGLGTAKSGETVRYKVTLKPGYKLDGAYDSNGKEITLLQDENGNYYVDVEVQDGGGIYLSVATSKTKHNISYNLDGGSYNGQIGTITEVYDYGTAIKLLGTPTREGYRFLYWRGSQYDAGADYTVEGDHLFTAVWEKISGGSDANDSHVPKTAAKASPATGDESELALWISIMAAAVLALVYTFVRRREYNR